jgi:hypothetical protein
MKHRPAPESCAGPDGFSGETAEAYGAGRRATRARSGRYPAHRSRKPAHPFPEKASTRHFPSGRVRQALKAAPITAPAATS